MTNCQGCAKKHPERSWGPLCGRYDLAFVPIREGDPKPKPDRWMLVCMCCGEVPELAAR